MKKAAFLYLSVVLFAGVSVFAQDFEQRATESPFECALFLASKEDSSIASDYFPRNLVKQGRYDEAILFIKLGKTFSSENELLIMLGNELLNAGKPEAADKFLTAALRYVREEDEWNNNYVPLLAASFIRRNRIDETNEMLLHQDDAETKVKTLVQIAEAYFNLGQKEPAEGYLNEAFALRDSFTDPEPVLDIIDLSVKHGTPQNSAEFLRLAEEEARSKPDENPSVKTVHRLALYYFKNNQKDKAFNVWNALNDKEDSFDSLNLVLALLKSDDLQDASALFKKFKLNADKSNAYGLMLVQVYLRFNDQQAAFRTAQEMSKVVDDYSQQAALMTIADKLIEERKTSEALRVLDFAFQRAAQVGEEHRDQDSIGASPLTRKIIYLRNIRNRYFKLNRFEQGLGVLNPLKIRDDFYQEFYAETLIEYTGKQLKTLPRKKTDELLTKAKKIFDEDEDYKRMHAELRIAELYGQLGDKPKTLAILTSVLKRTIENSSSQEEFLILAATLFDKFDLKADADLKKVLQELIDN